MSESAVTLLVGTRKGLFRLESDPVRGNWQLSGPFMAGNEIMHIVQSPEHSAHLLVSTNHPIWGAHIYASHDQGHNWQSLENTPHHQPGSFSPSLKAIWFLATMPQLDVNSKQARRPIGMKLGSLDSTWIELPIKN